MLEFWYDAKLQDWVGSFSFTVEGITRECRIFSTYLMYDIPRMFACRDKMGQVYFVENVEETRTACRWYAVPVSEEKLTLIEKGDLPINAVFDTHMVYDLIETFESGEQIFGAVIDGRTISREDLHSLDLRLNVLKQEKEVPSDGSCVS